jgi:hypothetical protein
MALRSCHRFASFLEPLGELRDGLVRLVKMLKGLDLVRCQQGMLLSGRVASQAVLTLADHLALLLNVSAIGACVSA